MSNDNKDKEYAKLVRKFNYRSIENLYLTIENSPTYKRIIEEYLENVSHSYLHKYNERYLKRICHSIASNYITLADEFGEGVIDLEISKKLALLNEIKKNNLASNGYFDSFDDGCTIERDDEYSLDLLVMKMHVNALDTVTLIRGEEGNVLNSSYRLDKDVRDSFIKEYELRDIDVYITNEYHGLSDVSMIIDSLVSLGLGDINNMFCKMGDDLIDYIELFLANSSFKTRNLEKALINYIIERLAYEDSIIAIANFVTIKPKRFVANDMRVLYEELRDVGMDIKSDFIFINTLINISKDKKITIGLLNKIRGRAKDFIFITYIDLLIKMRKR